MWWGQQLLQPSNKFLSRLDYRNTNSNLMYCFSQELKKLTGLTLLIPLFFHNSTTVYTLPQHNPTNGHTSKL